MRSCSARQILCSELEQTTVISLLLEATANRLWKTVRPLVLAYESRVLNHRPVRSIERQRRSVKVLRSIRGHIGYSSWQVVHWGGQCLVSHRPNAGSDRAIQGKIEHQRQLCLGNLQKQWSFLSAQQARKGFGLSSCFPIGTRKQTLHLHRS